MSFEVTPPYPLRPNMRCGADGSFPSASLLTTRRRLCGAGEVLPRYAQLLWCELYNIRRIYNNNNNNKKKSGKIKHILP